MKITQITFVMLLSEYAELREKCKRQVNENALDRMKAIEDYLWERIEKKDN